MWVFWREVVGVRCLSVLLFCDGCLSVCLVAVAAVMLSKMKCNERDIYYISHCTPIPCLSLLEICIGRSKRLPPVRGARPKFTNSIT